MNPAQITTVKAFFTALYQLHQLQETLPPDIQRDLNNLRVPDELKNLDLIAKRHPPLKEYYFAARDALREKGKERSKGFLPDDKPERRTTEVSQHLRDLTGVEDILDRLVEPKFKNESQLERDIIKPILSSEDSSLEAYTILSSML